MTRLLVVDSGLQLPAARVHKNLLHQHLDDADTSHVDAGAWLAQILPDAQHVASAAGARAFALATGRVDVVMPSHECIPFMPALCELRNRAASPVRFVVVAHSPAAHPLEWALLARFFAPGDAIVAPTRSARDMIVRFAPALGPHIHVVAHPMGTEPVEKQRTTGTHLVSLARVTPNKLHHRVLDALALLPVGLRSRIRLDVAGSTGPSADATYANALRHRAGRLGLGAQVRFLPELGDQEKWRLLAKADVLVNLSIDRAESFGMAAVEAMAMGAPVLTTAWDGLVETVGDAGACVAVHDARPAIPVDVAPERIAASLHALIADTVDPDVCRAQAARSAPTRVIPELRRVIGTAVGHEPGPVLTEIADLGAAEGASPMSLAVGDLDVGAAFDVCLSVPGSDLARDGLRGWARRQMLVTALDAPIARAMAGLPADPVADAAGALIARGFDALSRSDHAGATVSLKELQVLAPDASGSLFLLASAEAAEGRWVEALGSAWHALAELELGEFAGPWLCLAARAARHAGYPDTVIDPMLGWLTSYPDGPVSATTWAALCATAIAAGREEGVVARRSLAMTRDLVGDNPVVGRLADATARLDAELIAL